MAKTPARSTELPRPDPPAEANAEPTAAIGDRVRAIETGYYEHVRRRVGDVFDLVDPKDFTESWMERVEPDTALRVSTTRDILRRHHDEEQAMKRTTQQAGASPMPTGDADPLGAGPARGAGDDDE